MAFFELAFACEVEKDCFDKWIPSDYNPTEMPPGDLPMVIQVFPRSEYVYAILSNSVKDNEGCVCAFLGKGNENKGQYLLQMGRYKTKDFK